MKTALQMETPSTTTEPGPRRAVFDSAPEILTEIYQNDVNMAVWQRPSPGSAIPETQLLTEKGFGNYRSTLSVTDLHNLERKLPNHAVYAMLSADILLLADMFSCLFELQGVGLRITALTQAMCPKFHVDRVPCRLITTYMGTGTQWLPQHCVDRSRLGPGSGKPNDAESRLHPSAQATQTLAPGDVALLKGESWEGNEGAGLVHRSPTVEPNRHRLLLTLDFASPSGQSSRTRDQSRAER
tara:strand:- start:22656 stop:23378 length:723 start_codon:yes stop_codon:yes gene_type:complete